MAWIAFNENKDTKVTAKAGDVPEQQTLVMFQCWFPNTDAAECDVYLWECSCLREIQTQVLGLAGRW